MYKNQLKVEDKVMRITKFLATGLVAVMVFATATGCSKNTSGNEIGRASCRERV